MSSTGTDATQGVHPIEHVVLPPANLGELAEVVDRGVVGRAKVERVHHPAALGVEQLEVRQ